MSGAGPNAYCNPDVLLRIARGGSTDALDRISRCYGQRLLAAGRHYCRNRTDAEDALQDAMLAIASHPDRLRSIGSLEGYLVRTVAHACHRMMRGRKNDPALHDSTVTPRAEPDAGSCLSCRGELGGQLQRALLSLGPNDRLILILAEIEGWSGGEIAAELGLSAGAVRTRLSRARSRMRHALVDWEPQIHI